MISFRQKELAEWMEKNFGIHDDDILKCAVGMSEEVGEVCHHVLKGTQKIRGGINGIDCDAVADGVVDTMIYGIQLLSKLNIDAEKAFEKISNEVLARDWKHNPCGK